MNNWRWTVTLAQRGYKCRECLCLWGHNATCLNTRCPLYGGKLEREIP